MIRPIPQGSRSKKKCSHKNSHISLRYSQNLFIGDNAKASVHQDTRLASITRSPLADCDWGIKRAYSVGFVTSFPLSRTMVSLETSKKFQAGLNGDASSDGLFVP